MGSSMELKEKTNNVIFEQDITYIADSKSKGVVKVVAALRDMTNLAHSTIK